jgi:hypothetical protein
MLPRTEGYAYDGVWDSSIVQGPFCCRAVPKTLIVSYDSQFFCTSLQVLAALQRERTALQVERDAAEAAHTALSDLRIYQASVQS